VSFAGSLCDKNLDNRDRLLEPSHLVYRIVVRDAMINGISGKPAHGYTEEARISQTFLPEDQPASAAGVYHASDDRRLSSRPTRVSQPTGEAALWHTISVRASPGGWCDADSFLADRALNDIKPADLLSHPDLPDLCYGRYMFLRPGQDHRQCAHGSPARMI
jgi:hypothetical protein